MITTDGKCRVDSVAVGEASFNLLGPAPALTVKYALCNRESGLRYGAGNRNQGWSQETLTCLQALADSIEKDICADVFDGDPRASAEEDALGTTDGVAGF
jgi:hypothetical protein